MERGAIKKPQTGLGGFEEGPLYVRRCEKSPHSPLGNVLSAKLVNEVRPQKVLDLQARYSLDFAGTKA